MKVFMLFTPMFELLWMGGLVVYFLVFLSPTPWFNTSVSLLYFEPFKAPQGYVPFNPCGSILYHANYTPPAVPNGIDGSRLERTWISWLGTCTQDADGRRFCTTPSVGRPQWNMTYIQANDTIYPARMTSRVRTRNILVSIVFSAIGFLAFTYIGLSYHFPSLRMRAAFSNKVTKPLGVFIFVTGIISLATMASTQFSQKELDKFAAVDNFYQQAPCGTNREIKPGLLMQGKQGKAYYVLWAAWLMCYIAAGAAWAWRVNFPPKDLALPDIESDAKLAAKAKADELMKDDDSTTAPVTTTGTTQVVAAPERSSTLPNSAPIPQSIDQEGPATSDSPAVTETGPKIGSKNPFAAAMAAVKAKSPSFFAPGKFEMPEPEPAPVPQESEKVDGPAFMYDPKQAPIDEETRRKEIAKANGLELPSEVHEATSTGEAPPEYQSKVA